jgi:hypothetical protein
MKKTIKYRLFHYYEEMPIPGQQGLGLVEKQAFFGEEADITRQEDLDRGEALGAFFSDKEAKQIQSGKYEGPEASLLGQGINMTPPETVEEMGSASLAVEEIGTGTGSEGNEGAFDAYSADSSEIAEYIIANNLNVSDTVALAGDDPELAEKILDAEAEVAAQNNADARKGVDDGLQKIINAGQGD